MFVLKDGGVHLSHTLLSNMQRCARMAYFDGMAGIKQAFIAPEDPRNVGKAYHVATQARVTGKNWRAELQRIFPNWREDLKTQTLFVHQGAMQKAHAKRWGDLPLEIVGAELKFSAELRNPFVPGPLLWHEKWPVFLDGKVDLLGLAHEEFMWGDYQCDPGLWVIELKTKSTVREDVLMRAKLMTQPQWYACMLDREVSGVLIDYIARPKEEHCLSEDETKEQWEVRREEARKQALRGELGTRLRKKADESDEDFKARRVSKGIEEADALPRRYGVKTPELLAVLDKYYEADTRFGRVAVPFDALKRDTHRRNISLLASTFLWNARFAAWPQNFDACRQVGTFACNFEKLCCSDSPAMALTSFVQKVNGRDVDPAVLDVARLPSSGAGSPRAVIFHGDDTPDDMEF